MRIRLFFDMTQRQRVIT